MFESSLINLLKSDAELVSYVSTLNGEPSIFSDEAPKCEFPYLVFTITGTSGDDPSMEKFNVMLDYFNYDKSSVNTRKAIDRIKYLLDQNTLQHDRYSFIRFSYSSGGAVSEGDPMAKHYNVQFSVRAGRKAWTKQF